MQARPSSTHLRVELGFIPRVRVSEKVAGQIQSLIVGGALEPGDKLPSERELVQRFQVSRSSVRDAIRTLELIGLVRSRQGNGTVVCDVSADALVVPLSTVLLRKRDLVAELLDVRKMIEPPLAARAAERATAEEISHLGELLRRQQQKMRRREPATEEDTEFHYTIALAARNSVVRKVLDVLMDLLRDSRTRGLQVRGRPRRSLEGHRRIVRAIRRRDPRAAESAMRRHLQEIDEVLLRALDQS